MKRFFWLVVVLSGVMSAASARAALPEHPKPRMTFLDNGEVRIGMDLALGGAVTFLSSKEHPGNIINSADLGRQIQMSHYSGPWPFVAGEKKPNPAWAGLGWNPIQTGDCYMNPSQVVEHRNNGKEVYIKCIPMQWPMNKVPGDCVFETWTTLKGPLVQMRYRCTNQREDTTFYRPCPQELPAVYTISKLWRLMAYTGDQPFTGDRLTHVTNDWRKPWPWTRFTATESWAALVDENDWGLGVFKHGAGEFHGGIHGNGRSDDPKHGSTAYVAPIHVENFDHNIVYEHRTDFMVGRLEEMRKRFNGMARKTPPEWRFERDRQHWTVRNATDQGWPLKGEWRIRLSDKKPRLESGIQCWRAEEGASLRLEMASVGSVRRFRLFWRRLDDESFDERKSVMFEVKNNGAVQTCLVALRDLAGYRGLLTGLAIEPAEGHASGDEIVLKSIRLERSGR